MGVSAHQSKFALPLPFCSFQTLLGARWCPPTPLPPVVIFFSLPIQMLVSSGNALRDTSRNTVSPALWASLSPVKLTQKTDHPNVLHTRER